MTECWSVRWGIEVVYQCFSDGFYHINSHCVPHGFVALGI